MCVPIQRVHRDSSGILTHVGGSTRDGVPWGLTVAEAVALQESSMYLFFVEVPAGQMVGVWVKTSSAGNKYLTTAPDGVAANNLDSLPDMPNPLAGVEPPFPLNIPGPETTYLMSITSIGYGGNNTLTPLATTTLKPSVTANEFIRPASFWTQKPRWFYLNAIVPFPAEIMVTQNGVSMERVPGDAPARRYALEAAGKGWWTLDFVLLKPDGTIDPTKPTRLTEIKVVIRPGSSAWLQKNIFLSLDAFSINPNCYIHPPTPPGGGTWGWSLHGSSVSFRVRLPAAVPPPPPPATITMPSVVGQRLDRALTILYGVGLRKIYPVPVGPVAMNSDMNVDAQNPSANDPVKLTDNVYLRTSLAVAQTGVKKIVVSNQSNRATSMDLWLFDFNTGTWDKQATVAYQAQTDVDLTDGHTYLIAAVDPTLLNCHTGQPDEGTCVYFAPQRNFVGDDNGLVVLWEIS
jgi:hypothetical protein